jgi:hypothetical protein
VELRVTGREIRVTNEARTHCRSKVSVRNWTIEPRLRLVRTFELSPPSGRVAFGGFPGLKPWAESCTPAGHKTKALSLGYAFMARQAADRLPLPAAKPGLEPVTNQLRDLLVIRLKKLELFL